MKSVEWQCPRCPKHIKANSENTLTIDIALHLKKHELYEGVQGTSRPNQTPIPDTLNATV